MATAENIKTTMDQLEEQLFENPNVTSFGPAPITNEEGEQTGEFLLEIGVKDIALEESLMDEGLSSFSNLEGLSVIDENGQETGEEIDVRIVETGEIRTLASLNIQSTGRHRPAAGGDSIGSYRYRNGGTLGALVEDDSGKHYLITNWHVLLNRTAKKGDQVLQPSRYDNGFLPHDHVANLTAWRLTDTLDFALAEIRTPTKNYLNSGTRCFGRIQPIPSPPAIGDRVKKCGRTSNLTYGRVQETHWTAMVSGYPGGSRTFRNQIKTSRMVSGGDSGAILVNEESGHAVGLCFAGNSKVSFANPLDGIMAGESKPVPEDILRAGQIPSLKFS